MKKLSGSRNSKLHTRTLLTEWSTEVVVPTLGLIVGLALVFATFFL